MPWPGSERTHVVGDRPGRQARIYICSNGHLYRAHQYFHRKNWEATSRTWRTGRHHPPPPDGRTAWVITQGGATLTQVSLPLGLVGYVIPVPAGVDDLAIAPSGKMAYAVGSVNGQVGSYSGSFVTPINLMTGVAEDPIVLHYDPYGIAISPDGRTIWVTGGTVLAGPKSRTPDLRSIDLATGRVDGKYSIPGGANDIANATSGG